MAALIAHVALDLADLGQLPASSFLLASTSASTSTKVGLPFVPRESIARGGIERRMRRTRSSKQLALGPLQLVCAIEEVGSMLAPN